MTARERNLAVVLFAAVILVGGGMLVYLFIYQPLDELWARLVPASVTITPRPPESSKARQGKGPPYTALSFTASGRARLEGVVRMLEAFHRTRLLHKVRNLTVTKKTGSKGELEVSLTAEALQV